MAIVNPQTTLVPSGLPVSQTPAPRAPALPVGSALPPPPPPLPAVPVPGLAAAPLGIAAPAPSPPPPPAAPPPIPAPAPGLATPAFGALPPDLRNSYAQQTEAARQNAVATQAAATQTQAALQQGRLQAKALEEQQQAAMDKQTGLVNDQMTKLDHLTAQYGNMKVVDPWASAGTKQKVFAAIGLILGGIGAGLTHQPNAALAVMNNIINRDIALQSLNRKAVGKQIGATRNLVATLTSRLGDMRQAQAAARLLMWQDVDSRLKIVAARQNSATASANYANAQAVIQQQQAQARAQFQQAALASAQKQTSLEQAQATRKALAAAGGDAGKQAQALISSGVPSLVATGAQMESQGSPQPLSPTGKVLSDYNNGLFGAPGTTIAQARLKAALHKATGGKAQSAVGKLVNDFVTGGLGATNSPETQQMFREAYDKLVGVGPAKSTNALATQLIQKIKTGKKLTPAQASALNIIGALSQSTLNTIAAPGTFAGSLGAQLAPVTAQPTAKVPAAGTAPTAAGASLPPEPDAVRMARQRIAAGADPNKVNALFQQLYGHPLPSRPKP